MSKIEKIDKEELLTLNTLHKDNRTIRVKQFHKQSKEAKLLNNFLYREAQLKIESEETNEDGDKYNSIDKYDTTLAVLQMRKLLGLEKTNKYPILIDTAINQLKKEIEIINYVDEEGNLWETQKMAFISYAGKKREKGTGEISYKLGIDNHMYHIIKESNNKNFTPLNIDIQKKLTSNGISLYEWLKSYQNMKGGYCPPLTLDILNEMFFANYKHLSKIKNILFKNIENINEKTDLKIREVINKNGKKGAIYLQVQENKEYKKLRLKKEMAIANQDLGLKKQKYKEVKTEEENLMIEKLLNKGVK